MCRLFGFRSAINSHVHKSLVEADNSLIMQSPMHPDGWGLAFYAENSPHIIRSLSRAIDNKLFKEVSSIISSQTVIAHLRAKTQGESSILDTHPFQYGSWTFAHNGNIKNFEKVRGKLRSKIDKDLCRFILGKTDSEIIFFLIITKLKRKNMLQNPTIAELIEVCYQTVDEIANIAGPLHEVDSGPNTENYLTFLITNGDILLGHQGGKHLHYSTYTEKCPDRDVCPHFSPECENPVDKSNKIKHLIFSSESTKSKNVWLPMKLGEIIATNSEMQLQTFTREQ